MKKKKHRVPVPQASAFRPDRSSWFLVAAAWLAVSLPLAWGIYKTLEKAALLFSGR